MFIYVFQSAVRSGVGVGVGIWVGTGVGVGLAVNLEIPPVFASKIPTETKTKIITPKIIGNLDLEVVGTGGTGGFTG
ncbi:hypothetical protein COT44_04240 [Candidatus Shapirobacteria bacterium CG08_land_8_20_14_0_20_39_18]|uniref:Uncharacterized protein n=1 Tax=Candidatus Shapirobacteria bacterium CG08_land_8_20_14_0_20_39_18 TaxID=1974883 RepID=A0A2M6XC66_9BACT|nr:MAG: hypothetical protein COT44_04240 [Candidatus Shapirobacteria bacterium CG08_land_8_20_14_0_20_39_18]PIY66392.1 MAG: hypothetical protein COY91_00425 [Candidatus Shapirobacteria bacterium CG_4_10_14_0_8_um_filter_39_15]PJE68309.1 MAG: hypothetical protein COU94_02480 [Candidatus Shapirobacteria bacterium CG10_big_fil_rev_8_21_14_0_10_38_8]